MSVAPPRPKGPHLNALRAFEAAARLGGFAAAAEELCVTPGAISQHVKALEDWAGAPLFERRSQGVALTPFGSSAAPELTAAFDAMGAAVRNLRARSARSEVNIAALPAVAQLWLSPRLPAIRAALPDVAVSVAALEAPPNLLREPFDLCIFYGEPTGAPGERVIADDVIFPVCAPEIAARLASPEDLKGETLLSDSAWASDWARWSAAAGGPDIAARTGPTFSLYSLAVEEAANGAGVLIGHEALVRARLKDGGLRAPFATRVRTGEALILTGAPGAPGSRGAPELIAELLAGA